MKQSKQYLNQSKGDNNYDKETCFNAWSILFLIDIREWSQFRKEFYTIDAIAPDAEEQFWKAWREFEA